MNEKTLLTTATLIALLAGCGSAEIVAPEPLAVLDTHPGNGSIVPAGDQPIAVTFSEDVVRELLEPALLLEETTEQGTPIRELFVTLEGYQQETFTAVYATEPLAAGTTYALTVKQETIRGSSGARMLSDLIRRFRTR